MAAESFPQILSELIALRSLSGQELSALQYVERTLVSMGYSIRKIFVDEDRYNLLAFLDESFAALYTTHIDVVPGPDALFDPKIIGSRLIGRGAVDAKGALVAMIQALELLKAADIRDVGLLIVVGEEYDGIGAKIAAEYFKGRGIRALINGEPTENQLALGHKGCVAFKLRTAGLSCHSGYPELGDDANEKLLNVLQVLRSADFGHDPVLGCATISVGTINAGSAINIISDQAEATVAIRIVGDAAPVIDQLEALVSGVAHIEMIRVADAIGLSTLPDFPTVVVNYMSDLPNLAPIAPLQFMCGPGSIHRAHTNDEYIELDELTLAASLYFNLIRSLRADGWR